MLVVNSELLGLYWDIGRRLLQWQREQGWGSAVVNGFDKLMALVKPVAA